MNRWVLGTLRRALMCALAAVVVAGLALLPTGPANSTDADDIPEGDIVSEVPAGGTPHVLDGRVYSVVKVGDMVVLGGTFTRARNNSDTTELARSRVLAFNANTGRISTTFVPNPNGTVNVVLPAGDGESVYIGGSFSSVNGVAANNLVRVRVSDGSRVAGFTPGKISGQVKDLRLANGQLWVAGGFTHVGGKARKALATVNPQTGALTNFFTGTVAGLHNGGYTTVAKIDVNPQQTRLVAVGNFDTLNDVKNHQMFVLDTSGTTAVPGDLSTKFYETRCSSSFDSYMRDVDVSPDGKFFVVSTTGAYGGSTVACDTTARFDFANSGADARPSWIATTGGDTTYGVEITDRVVYTGGHARWQNNSYAGDWGGPGSVSRPGVAALDTINGLPYSWNATRTRGVGLFDFLDTPAGLWATSDTDRFGQGYFYKGRVALLPSMAGKELPAMKVPQLPNDVYLGSGSGLSKRSFDGSTASASANAPTGGIDWGSVRGAFMLNGQVYTTAADGSFTRRDFNGQDFGAAEAVNAQDELTVLQDWRNDSANMTGMFFDFGRIYFTLAGSDRLYYRYFNPESKIVGAVRYTASNSVTGLNYGQVRGMFLAGDKLFWRTSNGNLYRADWQRGFQSGSGVAGTASLVSGPNSGGVDWNASTYFLFQNAEGLGAPLPPTAKFDIDCVSLTCTMDASDSSAPGSSISDYSWAFSDGTTGAGKTFEKTFSSGGTYSVDLTITTANGDTTTTSRQVTVSRVNTPPEAAFTSDCTYLSCEFDSSVSTDDDGIVDRSWSFGDGQSATGETAQHQFAAPGSYDVTLTVTDSDNVTRSVTHAIEVEAEPTSSVEFVDADATNGNRARHSVTIPGTVQPGDRMLLFLSINSSAATVTPPAGWTQVETGTISGTRAIAWTRVATSTDPGSTVSVPLSATAKGNLTISAYRTGLGTPEISGSDVLSAQGTTDATAPSVAAVQGDWIVNYWGVKSSSPVELTIPGSRELRSATQGAASGAIYSWMVDSNGPVPAGPSGTVDAVASVSVNRVVAFSIALGKH